MPDLSVRGCGLKLVWIVVCMVAARSVAMAFNRVLDAEIDGRNPRTRMRHLPAGSLSRAFAWGFIAVWAVVFLFAARELNPLCFELAPLALAILMFYSYTKRFTSLSHVVLGFSLGIAPAAAWIAMRGSLDPRILWLTAAVTLWTAGFDIILLVPGLRVRRRGRVVQHPPALRDSGGAVDFAAAASGDAACLVMLVKAFALGGLAWAGDRGGRGPAAVGAPPGLAQRSFARRRGVLHHERLCQRDILCILGQRHFLEAIMTPVFDDPRLLPIRDKVEARRTPDC